MKIEDLQPEWLTELLRAGGSLPSGAVAAVQVNRSSRHFSTVARLQVQYTADAPSTTPTALFLKSSNRPSEWVFHAEVKPTLRDAPAIRCLGSRVEQEVTWLLFDDMSGTHLSLPENVPPTRAIYEQMVDCLAGLHVQRWEDAQMRERFATRKVARGCTLKPWEAGGAHRHSRERHLPGEPAGGTLSTATARRTEPQEVERPPISGKRS